jgi:hypothetical protein
MLKWSGKFVGWLVVLLVGLFLISTLTFHTGLAGSGAGTGVFSHSFRARFDIRPEFDEGSSKSGSMIVEARHPARLMLWGHASPKYRHAKIEWFLFREEESIGNATIDLEKLQIARSGKVMPLDTKNLLNLFEISDATAQDRLMVGTLAEFLQAAKDGDLPRPNHHGHSLPKPLPGRMQHFATGFSLSPLELTWVIVWSGFGLTATKGFKRGNA